MCQNELKCTFHMWSCHWLSLPLCVVWSDPISLILFLKMSPDSLIKAPVKVCFSVNATSTLKQQALQHTQSLTVHIITYIKQTHKSNHSNDIL